jgi:4-hydroxy-2-oxoheptanedioate aldolase
MGLPLGLDNQHPDHLAAVAEIRSACDRHDIPPGIHCGSAVAVNQRIEEGFKWIALSSDAGLMTSAAKAAVGALHWEPRRTGDVVHE